MLLIGVCADEKITQTQDLDFEKATCLAPV